VSKIIESPTYDVNATSVSESQHIHATYSGGYAMKCNARAIRKKAEPFPSLPNFDYPDGKGGWAKVNGKWQHYCCTCGEPNGSLGVLGGAGRSCRICYRVDAADHQAEKKKRKFEARRVTQAIKQHSWARKVMEFESHFFSLDSLGNREVSLHNFFSLDDINSPADALMFKEDYEEWVASWYPAKPPEGCYHRLPPMLPPRKQRAAKPCRFWGYY
jgi:hypothetical protein